MPSLDGRIALVTGGASGIGLASARALSAAGASVVIADKDGDGAQVAAESINHAGGSAVSFQADVSSLVHVRAMVDFVEKTYGRLHVFFSNAGIGGAKGFDVTEEEFDQVFNINLKSHFFATNYALPLMRLCAPNASIIYTSSVRGVRASPETPLYCMSKATILMMARTFALHLGPSGIRANALCVGAVDTAFPRNWMGISEADHLALRTQSAAKIPVGRIGQPEEIASLVTFLASDQSLFLTGATIPIDGGSTA